MCIAEGAGQDVLNDDHSVATDASGNPILQDIGLHLRSEFKKYFKGDADIKYIGEISAKVHLVRTAVRCCVMGGFEAPWVYDCAAVACAVQLWQGTREGSMRALDCGWDSHSETQTEQLGNSRSCSLPQIPPT